MKSRLSFSFCCTSHSLFLALVDSDGACKVDDEEDRKDRRNNDSAERVHAELDVMNGLIVNVEGKGLEVGGAYEMADDEIVKRHRKSKHHTRNDTGNDLGKLNHEERARGRASKVLCRLGKTL